MVSITSRSFLVEECERVNENWLKHKNVVGTESEVWNEREII